MCAYSVAEAAFLAQFLKKPGTCIGTEYDVEQVKGESALVTVSNAGKGDGKLGLLDIAGRCDDAGCGGRLGRERRW